MDLFDQKINEEVKSYLTSQIKIDQKEKVKLNEAILKRNKEPRKFGYYASIAGVIILFILLITPMISDFNNSNKPGSNIERATNNHIEKESHLTQKQVPYIEVDKELGETEQPQENTPVHNPIEESPSQAISSDEAFSITENLFTNIKQLFNEAGDKYKWSYKYDRNFVESEYGPFAQELRQFAAEEFVHGTLFETAKEFCYSGCDLKFFPNFYGTIRQTISQQTENMVTLSFLETPNMLHSGNITNITIQRENNQWKVSNFESTVMELIDYQITREEADQLVSHKEGVTFQKEVKGTHERIYWDTPDTTALKTFETTIYIYYNPDVNSYIGIYSDDGSMEENSYVLEEYLK
ncbi:hypothetical protein [Ferdinandcohnia sp. Marseille-Q9671]